MPLFCFYRSIGETYLHQVVPALEDTSLIHSYSELTETELERVKTAREYVIDICTTDAIPVMSDAEWVK